MEYSCLQLVHEQSDKGSCILENSMVVPTLSSRCVVSTISTKVKPLGLHADNLQWTWDLSTERFVY